MSEPCPPHLDEEGKELWEQCTLVIEGRAVTLSFSLQLQALAIRRELRMESEIHRLERLEVLVKEMLQDYRGDYGKVGFSPKFHNSVQALADFVEDKPCT